MLAAAQAKEVANAPYSEFEQIMGDEGFLAMVQKWYRDFLILGSIPTLFDLVSGKVLGSSMNHDILLLTMIPCSLSHNMCC